MVHDTGITYEEELKKNPEVKKSDIQTLQEWCAKQPHLPKISNVQLVLFLHRNYFSIEKTKHNIEMYCTLRTHLPEMFSNRDPVESKELRMTFKTIACTMLKKLSYDGYKIIFTKIMDPDPSHYNFIDVMKYLNMYTDLNFYIDGTLPGCICICNVGHLTLGHLCRFSPMALKKSLIYIQEGMPARLKGIHFTNTVPAMNILMRMMRPFIQKDLVQMIHFHSTAESLAKFIPLDALPNDEGGNAGNLADMVEKSVKWLENNRAWFQIDEATMRVNESLRPGKGKTSTDLFGIEGSFKKLEFD